MSKVANLILIQGVALMGRNTTGPPSRKLHNFDNKRRYDDDVCCPWWVILRRHEVLQTTTDTSEQNNGPTAPLHCRLASNSGTIWTQWECQRLTYLL